jgi:hypothetical protein
MRVLRERHLRVSARLLTSGLLAVLVGMSTDSLGHRAEMTSTGGDSDEED